MLRQRLIQNGFALVVVLNIIVVLSGIAIVASQGSREGAAIAANFRSDAEQKSLAEAAVALAVSRLTAVESERRWLPDGRPYRVSLFGDEAIVSVQDESGKLGLNTMDEASLARAFANAGLAASKAQDLAAAIADWRDPDNERRLSGAERAEYAAVGLTGAPANGPFNRIDELRGVIGMTEASYATLLPLVTTYAVDPSVNLNVAPLPVLTALFGRGSPETSAILKRRSQAASGFAGVGGSIGASSSDGLTRQVGSASAPIYSIAVMLQDGGSARTFRGALRLQKDSLGPRIAVLEAMDLDRSDRPH